MIITDAYMLLRKELFYGTFVYREKVIDKQVCIMSQ